MPATLLSPRQFHRRLEESGLVEEDGLSRLRQSVSRGVDDPLVCAEDLVLEGFLTRFQAAVLLQRDWEGLRIRGRFTLLEVLGQGSLGEVYLAEDLQTERQVALKVLPLARIKNSYAMERFERDLELWKALKCANVLRCHGMIKVGQFGLLLMELVEGQTLEAIVDKQGPIPPSRAARWIGHLASGLQRACEAGLVHQGIRPANLFLSTGGLAKIADYALTEHFPKKYNQKTKFFQEKHLRAAAAFQAPECALGSSGDVRSDIYGLGATFYYLLTGQEMFPFGTLASILLAHQHRQPPPIQEVQPGVPSGIVEIVNRMLEKKPEDRFQEPRELAKVLVPWAREDFQEILDPLLVEEEIEEDKPTPKPKRKPKPSGLLPYLLIGGGVLAVLLLALLAVVTLVVWLT
jgi:serine/threonine protein kinase